MEKKKGRLNSKLNHIDNHFFKNSFLNNIKVAPKICSNVLAN
jgi:hypothetical protein